MPLRYSLRALFVAIAVCCGVGAWLVQYHRWKYPYGSSHCCILGVMMALENYAQQHGGRYPSGETSPEASLSLLYKAGLLDPYTLRGMTVPEETTVAILQKGKLLSDSSCGWHYVEGLTQADDHRLALLWCKEALGHNGERNADNGRQVVFIGGDVKWVSGAEWDEFLEGQKRFMSRRSDRAKAAEPCVSAVIELPGGKRVQSFAGPYSLEEDSQTPTSSGSGSSSGGSLTRESLTWFQPPIEEGKITWILSFSNLISEPETVTFAAGVPNRSRIVFEMRGRKAAQ